MGDDTYNYRIRYDPSNLVYEENIEVKQPADLATVQGRQQGDNEVSVTRIGVANSPSNVQFVVTRADRFRELCDKQENARLHVTLMNKFGKNNFH
jgi:hypothetical protein